MYRSAVAFFAALTLVTAPGAAQAHPELKASSPAAGAHVASPKEIRITFTEEVYPKFSGVTLTDPAGRTVKTGKATVNPKDERQLVVPLKAKLRPGVYRVSWRAVSADTHRITGAYTFMVH